MPISGQSAPLAEAVRGPNRRSRRAAGAQQQRQPPAPTPTERVSFRLTARAEGAMLIIEIAAGQTIRLTLDRDAGWAHAEEIVSALQTIDAEASPLPELTAAEAELLAESMTAVRPTVL